MGRISSDQLRHAADIALDEDPISVLNALGAVLDLDLRADDYSRNPEDIGYCRAMRDVRAAIESALGIQEGGDSGE